MTITIAISEAQLEELRDRAQRAGLSPEELARATLEEWLRQPQDDFASAADYVLRKNEELYRRLA